jgi:hypothetical protein
MLDPHELGHAIDIGEGKVTFQIPILLMLVVFGSLVSGFFAVTGFSVVQTYDNQRDLELISKTVESKANTYEVIALQKAIQANQEILKTNQASSTNVVGDMADLKAAVLTNSNAILNLTTSAAERAIEQRERDQREWARIQDLIKGLANAD